jgi:small subunit ribosomal protein S21
MAIRIKSRSGEGTEQMMRRFKKLCEKEGLTKDIKRKEFYEKPSERRRRAARKSLNRRIKIEMGEPLKKDDKDKRPPRQPM